MRPRRPAAPFTARVHTELGAESGAAQSNMARERSRSDGQREQEQRRRQAPTRPGADRPGHHPRKTPTANHAQHLGSPVRTLPLRPPGPPATWPVNAHGATGNGSKNSDGDKHRHAPERTGSEHHPRKTPAANHAQHLGSPVRALPLRPPRPAGKCAAEGTTNGRVSGSARPRRVPRRQGAPSAQIRPSAARGTTQAAPQAGRRHQNPAPSTTSRPGERA